MAFTRAFLKDNGVPEDRIDAIMGERNRTLSDYIPKADVQEQIDAAVKKAVEEAKKAQQPAPETKPEPKAEPKPQVTQPEPKPVTEYEEYKKIVSELEMVKALNGDDYAEVKPKFRETVYKMLDHGEKAKPIAEQLTGVKEKYEEYFTPAQKPEAPVFGSKDRGGMPSGTGGDSFAKAWGFIPNQKG